MYVCIYIYICVCRVRFVKKPEGGIILRDILFRKNNHNSVKTYENS